MKKFNHFSVSEANVNINRSSFSRPNSHKGTMPTGKLIPLYVDEVLPGDTRKITMSSVIRGATPIFPVMDNAFFDVAAFFIPHRLVFDKWEEFMGENNNDSWTNKEEVVIPRVSISVSKETMPLLKHTPIDYMNCIGQLIGVKRSTGNSGTSLTISSDVSFTRSFSALYPRSMCKVWNDWYRNQNTQDPCHISTGMEDVTKAISNVSVNTKNYVDNAEFGTCLLPVNKFKDYFTSALPAPQKHAPISLPLGEFAPIQNNYAPIQDSVNGVINTEGFFSPFIYAGYTNTPINFGGRTQQAKLTPMNYAYPGTDIVYTDLGYIINPNENVGSGTPEPSIATMNLVANLREATAVTVNQLRLAFQTQKFYEKQALYGSRYTELLYSMFGVYSADARLQRAEFLGGKRIPIHQYQVNQTAPSLTEGADGLGTTSAFSLTNDKSRLVDKSFTEHGLLMIFGYVRTYQSYSQGQDKMFTRREMFDYYFPVFSHIGEQPIKNDEIFAIGKISGVDTVEGQEVFGYQEAYAEYRFKQNRISGELRPELPSSLSAWHYGSRFENLPVLSSQFVQETENNVKRSQAVQGDPQWIFDCFFDDVAVRPMPVYSVPGLIDHF